MCDTLTESTLNDGQSVRNDGIDRPNEKTGQVTTNGCAKVKVFEDEE